MLLSEAVADLFEGGRLRNSARLESCPVCSHTDFEELFVLRGFAHHRCRGCGFIFVNPRLNEEGARAYYNSDYYRGYCENNERPLNEVSGPYCRTFGAELPEFVARLRQLGPGGRMLDAGCGLGGLLASMPAAEYDLVGLEYNDAAAEFARSRYGLRVARSMGELSTEAFDLITAVELIEHVAEPRRFIRDLATLLKPTGHLVLTTPNIASLDYYFYRERCAHFCAPSHVNFFSLRTLTRLAEWAGLERVAHWYRGGVISFRHWWRTRGREVDFWSPEIPTRGSGNVVYRPKDGSGFELPPLEAFGAATTSVPRGSALRRLLSKGLASGLSAIFAQTQMVVVLRRARHRGGS